MLWDRVWSPDLPSCCPGCIQPCKAPSGGNSGESPAQGQAFCRTTLFPVTSAKLPPGSHSAGPCAPTRPQGRRHPALVLLQGLAVPVLRPSGCEGARSRPRAVESPQHLRARVLKCGARALRCETQPESRPPAPMVSPDPPGTHRAHGPQCFDPHRNLQRRAEPPAASAKATSTSPHSWTDARSDQSPCGLTAHPYAHWMGAAGGGRASACDVVTCSCGPGQRCYGIAPRQWEGACCAAIRCSALFCLHLLHGIALLTLHCHCTALPCRCIQQCERRNGQQE